MTFYTGSSPDGSDMREVQGAYINPNNPNEWSSKPYPSQRKIISQHNRLMEYMNGRYCLNDVYAQIQNKTCELPFSIREYVLSIYKKNETNESTAKI